MAAEGGPRPVGDDLLLRWNEQVAAQRAAVAERVHAAGSHLRRRARAGAPSGHLAGATARPGRGAVRLHHPARALLLRVTVPAPPGPAVLPRRAGVSGRAVSRRGIRLLPAYAAVDAAVVLSLSRVVAEVVGRARRRAVGPRLAPPVT